MTTKFPPTKLNLVRPVPSDIDIAETPNIKLIRQVAKGKRYDHKIHPHKVETCSTGAL